MREKSSLYRPDIDGLRAISVLMVVLFHAFPTLLPGGFVGVDVFFVISGFLITRIILNHLNSGDFSYLDFYIRRCRRIIPALFVVLMSSWLLGWFVLLAGEFESLSKHIIAGAAFSSNILLWNEVGYFDRASELKPLLHLWSLGIEEQFYIFWPLLLSFFIKRRSNLLMTVMTITVISFVLNISFISNHGAAVFYLLPFRFWELLVGGCLAISEIRIPSENLLIKSKEATNSITGSFISLFGVTLLITFGFLLNRNSVYPGWSALGPTLAAFCIVSAGGNNWISRVCLSNRPLVFLGLISYPLYLWHWPLLSMAHIVEETIPSAWVRFLMVVVSFFLAWLTWRFVERPIQSGKILGKNNSKIYLEAVGLSLVLVSILAVITLHDDGFSSRFPELEKRRNDILTERAKKNLPKTCGDVHSGPYDLDICMSSSTGKIKSALYGDSHAEALLPGLISKSLPNSQWMVIGEGNCAPLYGISSYNGGDRQRCLEANKRIVNSLIANHDISTVVLASLGPRYFSGKNFSFYHVRGGAIYRLESELPSDSFSQSQLFFKGLSRTVQKLEEAGKRVVFFVDVPELPFDPLLCLNLRPFQLSHHSESACILPRSVSDERVKEYKKVIMALQASHPSLIVFDPTELFCDKNECHAFREGRSLYEDSHHLSLWGSEYLASHFLDQLSGTIFKQ